MESNGRSEAKWLTPAGIGVKGSFHHHFKDKQDFALQVIDAYITEVHGVLDACLMDAGTPPLVRVRNFFEIVMRKYREEG